MLRLLNQVNSLPSLSSRELSLREDSLGIFLLILGKGRKERGRGEMGEREGEEGKEGGKGRGGGSLTYNDRILDTPLRPHPESQDLTTISFFLYYLFSF